MNSNFDLGLTITLGYEGGYSNDAHDPGGATNHGITWRDYNAWRKEKGLPLQDVKLINMEEVKLIYKAHYWDALKCDDMPSGVDFAIFDYGVNSGVGKAGKDLQRTLGPLYTGLLDGILGAQTMTAINQVNDIETLVKRICDRRMEFLRSLKTFRYFGKGWTRRVEGDVDGYDPNDVGVGDYALKMYRKEHAEIKPPQVAAPGKASPVDVAGSSKPTSIALGTTSIGAIGTAITTAAQQIQPLGSIAPIFLWLFGGLMVVGVILSAIATAQQHREST